VGAVTARRLGGALLALLLGVPLGAGVAFATRPGHESTGTPVPLEAVGPPVPTDDPYAEDIDDPPLGAVTEFDTYEIGTGPQLQTWEYAVPRGWVGYRVASGAEDRLIPPDAIEDHLEVRFRPLGEVLVGGYSIRVKAINNHRPAGDEVQIKVTDFERLYEDVEVLERTDETVFFRFRAENDTLRYNFFHWFTEPGAGVATLEMSIAGRSVDEPAMRTLFEQFADRVTAVDD
jgi:hypothetical protein